MSWQRYIDMENGVGVVPVGEAVVIQTGSEAITLSHDQAMRLAGAIAAAAVAAMTGGTQEQVGKVLGEVLIAPVMLACVENERIT